MPIFIIIRQTIFLSDYTRDSKFNQKQQQKWWRQSGYKESWSGTELVKALLGVPKALSPYFISSSESKKISPVSPLWPEPVSIHEVVLDELMFKHKLRPPFQV